MIKLLKDLQENTSTPDNGIWKVYCAADSSGELVLDETPLAVFDNKSELKALVDALLSVEKTLTMSLIYEVLSEVGK